MKKNIVFIGMPGSGKSTLAKQCAKKMNLPFYDSDDEIVKKMSMSIPQIFATMQESGFRAIEKEVLLSLSQKQGCILSTGGGSVLCQEAMQALQKNSWIIFIDRNPSLLTCKDANRPLSSSKEAIKKLYETRIGLYRKYADAIVPNNGKIEEALQALGGIIDDYHNY